MARNGVVDASLLLSLSSASSLNLLWNDPHHDWHLTPLVRNEIQREPARSEVSNAVLDGRLGLAELAMESSDESGAWARWSGIVDPGEAEAIAVATTRGWVVGIEDRFAQRRLTEAAGPESWVNAATLLVSAIEEGRLSLPSADLIFQDLDCYPGYAKRGITSVADLRGR